MRKTLIIIAVVMAAFPLRAQNLESVLSSVERNNTTLKVLRAEADAAKAEARSGLTPPIRNLNWAISGALRKNRATE